MALLALTRSEFSQLLHGFVPTAIRVVAILLLFVYAAIAWQRWSFYSHPKQRIPRVLGVGAAALAFLVYLVWRWL